MIQRKPFTFQLLVMGGFLFFFYMFFALTTSVYRDYKLNTEIATFQNEIDNLAQTAEKKPSDLKYLQSPEYKDRYAKENLHLLNPGEKVIILPDPKQNIEQGPVQLMTELLSPDSVLNKPNKDQWWAYFFGRTLTVTPTINIAPIRLFEGEKKKAPGEPSEG